MVSVVAELVWLVPHETATLSVQVLYTPCNHAACHLMQSHMRKVYACLAVTCHLHIWQNERGLLRATAVTGHVLLEVPIVPRTVSYNIAV